MTTYTYTDGSNGEVPGYVANDGWVESLDPARNDTERYITTAPRCRKCERVQFDLMHVFYFTEDSMCRCEAPDFDE